MNLGGAETMIMNYFRNVDRSKIIFDFLLLRPERGAYDDEIEALGGIIYRLPPISPSTFFVFNKELKEFFKVHPEYDIVHSHLNSLSTFILKAAKPTANIRIAHSHIAISPIKLKDFFNKNLDLKTTIKEYIQSKLKTQVAKHATHYFACGEKAGRWMFGDNAADKVTVLNNAIDAAKFKFDQNISLNKKEELGLKEKIVIGHVGRFNDQKNHLFLISIFNEVLKNKPNTVLLLVGVGDLMPKIKSEADKLGISESILFLGARRDIPELLQCFDLFLFPSLYEGLPVTLIEAQAAGLNIIASNTITSEVNFGDLITFISLEQSPELWAKMVIEKLNYDREDTQKMIIENHYDIKSNARMLEEFYLTQ